MTHVILKPMGLQPPTLISSLFLQHLTSRPCLQELSKQLHYEGVGEKSRPIDLAAGSLALTFYLSQKSRFTANNVAAKNDVNYTFHILGVGNSGHFLIFTPGKRSSNLRVFHIFSDGLVTFNHQLRPRYLQIQMPREKVTEKDEDGTILGSRRLGDDPEISEEKYTTLCRSILYLYIYQYNPISRYVYVHIII